MSLDVEEYLQDGDDGCKREDVEYGCQDIEYHRAYQITLIGRYEPSDNL